MGFMFLILMATIATAVAFPTNNQNYLVMPHSGSGSCLSWRFGVEANNVREWTEVPRACVDYVGHYMRGSQYKQDCKLVCDEAYAYAKGLDVTGDGKDVWFSTLTKLHNLISHISFMKAIGKLSFLVANNLLPTTKSI
ncbi:acid phosphatase 1-like [Bidens hawaiensis]|uniref:acid phosphatase 1-like n=1 Tax=Bidens hawaiensis TaxID=980011 RepID=UPI00404A0350